MAEKDIPCATCPYRECKKVELGGTDFVHVVVHADGELTYGGYMGCGGAAGRISAEQLHQLHTDEFDSMLMCRGAESSTEDLPRNSFLGRVLKITDTVEVRHCPAVPEEAMARIIRTNATPIL
jgi:hypothetical protein